MRAKQLLKARALWRIPVIVGSIFLVLMTAFYISSVVNPVGHLRGLPVSLVNEDAGATIGPRHIDLGDQLQSGLAGSHTVSKLLSIRPEQLAAAEDRMNHNGAYATVVIPPNFTASLLSLTGRRLPPGTTAGKPTVKVLTNQRAGSVGVQLASGILQPAIARASHVIGRHGAASPGRRIGDRGGAGRSAHLSKRRVPAAALARRARSERVYIALLTRMCGFIAATIINATVDAATGYATTDIGPKWRQRTALPVNRWQTLLTKWAMALPVTALLTGVMLAVAVGLFRIDAPHAGYLWLFTWLAAASVAAGTLVLFAALASQAQLVALLQFVYLGLASAGGTVPLQALPGPLRLASQVEPLRQILDDVRSILYFNAAGSASSSMCRNPSAATAPEHNHNPGLHTRANSSRTREPGGRLGHRQSVLDWRARPVKERAELLG